MDKHIGEHYHQFADGGTAGNYHAVIPLHVHRERPWEELQLLAPSLPRGWYELAQLDIADRCEFTREFWLSKLPFLPHTTDLIDRFFERLDDVGIFVFQKNEGDPYQAHQVYSLRDDGGFFWGLPPTTPDAWANVQIQFEDRLFPEDYIAFIQIHDGFGKHMDTGTMSTKDLHSVYQGFQQFLVANEPLKTAWGDLVDPKTLIPFYESFGLHSYQCFWSDWYPGTEMGNVYYSGQEQTLSLLRPDEFGPDVLSFSTFLDWLAFYTEGIE